MAWLQRGGWTMLQRESGPLAIGDLRPRFLVNLLPSKPVMACDPSMGNACDRNHRELREPRTKPCRESERRAVGAGDDLETSHSANREVAVKLPLMELQGKDLVRTRSKAIFGNSYRLELLAVVARLAEPFSPRDVARRMGIADNLVATQLRQLCAAGLLDQRVPSRGIRYDRKPSILWKLARTLEDEILQGAGRASPAGFEAVSATLQLAGALVTGVDVRAAEALVRTVVLLAASGQLQDGLRLEVLAERARMPRGRLADVFQCDWDLFVDVALRAMLAQAGLKPLCEVISSVPFRVGRRSAAFGVARAPGRGSSLHLLVTSVLSQDEAFPLASAPLTIGTSDDPRSQDFDPERAARIAAQLDLKIPTSLGEHVAAALARTSRARDKISDGLRRQPDLLARELASSLMDVFPSPLIVGPLAYGPPAFRGVTSAGVLTPGTDPDVLAVVAGAHRPALLYCGDDVAVPRSSRGWVWLDSPSDASYCWNPGTKQLTRIDPLGSAQAWRYAGFSEADMLRAIEALEHYEMAEQTGRIVRWAGAAAPGRIQARHAGVSHNLLGLINLANAAALAVGAKDELIVPMAETVS